jgi:hypothetical protein
MSAHIPPPMLPERGKWRFLFAYLNSLREYVMGMRLQISHGIKTTQGPMGVLLEGNFGDGFKLAPGIAIREMDVCLKITDANGNVTGHEEAFVRGYFSVVFKKNDDGNPVDSDGNELDETTDPPIPDLTDTDVVSGFEINEGG